MGHWKRRRWVIAAATVLTLTTGAVLVDRMTPSTPVSEREAIEHFRAAQEVAEAPIGVEAGRSEAAPTTVSARTTPPRAPTTSAPEDAASGGEGSVVTLPFRPAPGVYTYTTTGGESISGVPVREFPSRTYRTVVHTSGETWTDHHLFLEERQSWIAYARREDGRVVEWTRNLVRFPGVAVDETTSFAPPIRSIVLPWQPGRRWEGTFSGETRGSYQGATVEPTTLAVGHAHVRTWLDELEVELHGDLEGSVRAKRWVAPDLALTVREEYEADVRRGPFTYTARWSVHLASLVAKT